VPLADRAGAPAPGGPAHAPPGWPAEVRPPGAPDWERTATAWLFDLCPPDYRAHEVLRRHPVVLARFAAGHVEAGVAAARTGLTAARASFADLLDDPALEAVLTAYEREGRRLAAALRGVRLVEEALRGRRFAARL